MRFLVCSVVVMSVVLTGCGRDEVNDAAAEVTEGVAQEQAAEARRLESAEGVRVSREYEGYSYVLTGGEVPGITVVIGERACEVPEDVVQSVPGMLRLETAEGLFYDSRDGTVRLSVGYVRVAGGPVVGRASFVFSGRDGFELMGVEEGS